MLFQHTEFSVHVDGALRPVDSSHHSDHAMQRVLEPHRLPNDGTLTELLRNVAPDRTEVLRRVERRHEPPFPELQAPQLGEVVGCAKRRFWEFFTAHIRNTNTRLAYLAAVRRFAVWCERWDPSGPLFRSCEPGRRDALQDGAMSRLSALKMIKRRARGESYVSNARVSCGVMQGRFYDHQASRRAPQELGTIEIEWDDEIAVKLKGLF